MKMYPGQKKKNVPRTSPEKSKFPKVIIKYLNLNSGQYKGNLAVYRLFSVMITELAQNKLCTYCFLLKILLHYRD